MDPVSCAHFYKFSLHLSQLQLSPLTKNLPRFDPPPQPKGMAKLDNRAESVTLLSVVGLLAVQLDG